MRKGKGPLMERASHEDTYPRRTHQATLNLGARVADRVGRCGGATTPYRPVERTGSDVRRSPDSPGP